MSGPDPLLCWLWLSHVLGSASLSTKRVLKKYGNAQNAWNARETEEFKTLVGPASTVRAQNLDPENYHERVMWCDALGVRILTCESMDYPQKLLRIPDLPLVLYCTGDTGWLNAPATVGIVGTRKPTEYGLRAAEDIGRGLAKAGAVIVSGLAEGLDSAGHRAALCERSPTIGILGIPIDRTYPTINRPLRKEIESNGCIISEYPPKSEPLGKYGFLQRNRLIAALSAAVVVVEAKEKSGTMYTVDYAKQYRRPVFAVPGSIYSVNSVGTNGLLRTGCAKAVTKAEDLFDVLRLKNTKQIPQAVRSTPAPMSETEKKVLACVSSESKGVEELIAESGLSASILSVTLMKLELSKQVIRLPGGRYILP